MLKCRSVSAYQEVPVYLFIVDVCLDICRRQSLPFGIDLKKLCSLNLRFSGSSSFSFASFISLCIASISSSEKGKNTIINEINIDRSDIYHLL